MDNRDVVDLVSRHDESIQAQPFRGSAISCRDADRSAQGDIPITAKILDRVRVEHALNELTALQTNGDPWACALRARPERMASDIPVGKLRAFHCRWTRYRRVAITSARSRTVTTDQPPLRMAANISCSV